MTSELVSAERASGYLTEFDPIPPDAQMDREMVAILLWSFKLARTVIALHGRIAELEARLQEQPVQVLARIGGKLGERE